MKSMYVDLDTAECIKFVAMNITFISVRYLLLSSGLEHIGQLVLPLAKPRYSIHTPSLVCL